MAHLDFAGLDGGFLSRPLSRFDLSSTFSCCESSTVFLRVDFSLLLVCSQWWHVEVGDPSLGPCEELQAPGGAMVFVIISGSLWSNGLCRFASTIMFQNRDGSPKT
ncbi:hypothetical protein IGI04_019643, partial [Brassica rapa subsp. trilocularis]